MGPGRMTAPERKDYQEMALFDAQIGPLNSVTAPAPSLLLTCARRHGPPRNIGLTSRDILVQIEVLPADFRPTQPGMDF